MFSCSNDKTINLWKIPKLEENSHDDYTITPSYQIYQYQKDYIKSLSYNDKVGILYAGGFDGIITQFDIHQFRQTNKITLDNANYLYKNSTNSSIFSIDSDHEGKLLLCSIYENHLM